MPTATELQAMNSKQWAVALRIDGIPLVFVDHKDLVNYDFGDDAEGRLGLSREGLSLPMSIDIRTGQGNADVAHFTIRDFEGDLARLFGAIDDSEEDLGNVPFGEGLPITPGEDLTTRTDLHGLYVGVERIGDDGERHLFPVPPGFDIGYEHGIAVPSLDLAGAPVTTNPIVWAGRKVAVYRIYRDHVTYPDTAAGVTSWRPWSERALLWYGTLKDQGTVSGRTWRLEADGWSSWLRKPLGLGFQAEPVVCSGETTLSDDENNDERQIAVRLFAGLDSFGVSVFVAPITDGTLDEIRDQVAQVIQDAAAAAGVDGTWNDVAGYKISMELDSSIQIAVANGDGLGFMQVELHRKVWGLLGYDVRDQSLLELDPDDPRCVRFDQVPNNYSDEYWMGTFPTGYPSWPNGEDNGGNTREWTPLYLGGTHILLAGHNGTAGQIVRLADATLGDVSNATVAHPGQLDREPIGSIDGTPCDRQGLFLFFGKRRFDGKDEEFDEYQIARASWVADVGQNAGLIHADKILLTEWHDPGQFGMLRNGAPAKRMPSDWIARDNADPELLVRAVPICVLGYMQNDALERSDRVMQRLLLSTGTSAGWSGGAQTAGDNEPSHDDSVLRDAERAALGLGIASDFVQSADSWEAEVSLVDEQSVLDVRAAFSTGYQALDVFRNLMEPVGWCWQLRGGQLGVFSPAHPLTLADVEVVLDRSVKADKYANGGRREAAEQQIRAFAPIDKFQLEYNWAPYLNKASSKAEHQARDAAFRYRSGTVTASISGHFHRPQLSGWRERVTVLSKWWARRHFWVKGWPVHLVNPGENIWPGTVVSLTDPELTDPAGEYSVTNRVGIVTATYVDLAAGSKKLDILVLADRSSSPYLNAPMARGWGYDTSTRRLYVRDNEWAIQAADGSWSDATAFAERVITGVTPLGGHAYVRCLQWNGVTWAETLVGDVESVVTTPGGAYLQLESGTVGGTYLRDNDTIVVLWGRVSHGQDAAWALATYAPICDEDGDFDDGTGDQAGFNWEP